MTKVQNSHESVAKTPAKKKKKKKNNDNNNNNNNNNNNKARSFMNAKRIYCPLCRRSYYKHDAQEHMHSMLHHRELETVLGKNSFHECQACKSSSMGLHEYARHISTAQHKAKLQSLMSKNVKPLPLLKILSTEAMDRILERNKKLKKAQKKGMKKKRKKLKQLDGQRRAETLQGAAGKNTGKQAKMKMLKQMQEPHQKAPRQRESALRNQCGSWGCLSRVPAGRTWHVSYVQDQFAQSAPQLRYEDNFFVDDQGSQLRSESSETDSFGPYSISQRNYYDSTPNTDFTCDYFPPSGATMRVQNERSSMGFSQPGQEGSHCAVQPASTNNSVNAASVPDIDVSAMLRQIRRALGMREPCRADREARKQNSEAGIRLANQAGAGKKQPAGVSFRNHAKKATTSAAATSVQSSPVSYPAPASHPAVFTSSAAPAKRKQATVKVPQEITQPGERSSVAASVSNGQPRSSKEKESQGEAVTSLSKCSGRTAFSEPNLTIARKVRIAHKSSKVQGGKESGLLNKLLSLSGAKGKLSWRDMYEETKRKKLERVKGMPRFGIELSNPLSDQESSTQAKDLDLPLSEGFHWESFPDSPSGAHWAELPPPPQDTIDTDSPTETQSASQMPEPPEQLGAAQEDCRRQAVDSVKTEPNMEDKDVDLRDDSSANKRKLKEYDGISGLEPSGKKKKTKSNKDQNQMDQLLAVSLREEELSHSLQDLDMSLIQARNALQAAYTEVQRLMLLRQQCTAEVNSLRAKRIEILQGMQGGYSGAEEATTSSAGAAANAQPRLSPLLTSSAFPTSSSQQPPHANPAPSISQLQPAPLALPTFPVKQEICQPPAASCNPDTPPVPVNQPVSLFPSDLLPSLMLTPPGLVAPQAAITTLKQARAECSSSANKSPPPESSARQQEQVMDRLVREEARPADSNSEEETRGNVGKEPAAERPLPTFIPERHQNASAAAPDDVGGNESDNSVEMMEPPSLVIRIDESDNEETASNGPVHQEPPQKSVSVDFSSSGTQTCQHNNAERKVQPTPASHPPECVEVVEVVEDEEPSIGAFINHEGPVLGLQVHDGLLYTCSGDNTARAYSLMTMECQVVFGGHTNKVNCLLVSSLPNTPARLYTGSSDQTIRCYSTKSKKCLEQISLSDRVLCLHVAWNILFAGLANGSVASYDLKNLKQLDVFECHGPRGVSCLGTAQEGARRVLLVGSYDSTISVRDAKNGLLLRSLEGHTKTVLCMKVVNDLVFTGSSDTSVHAYNIHTGELVRIYKGHGQAVTSLVILGKVMVTACLDKLVRVYELQSHDRLQVYGGHSDMVMCMAVNKSVIYTGCYDGSVQAVKLNLMKNYRCWWQNCSLIFGLAEHLVQHLVGDHTNPNLEMVKCRWKCCSSFFASKQSVRQELLEHMQRHVENDSKEQQP